MDSSHGPTVLDDLLNNADVHEMPLADSDCLNTKEPQLQSNVGPGTPQSFFRYPEFRNSFLMVESTNFQISWIKHC